MKPKTTMKPAKSAKKKQQISLVIPEKSAMSQVEDVAQIPVSETTALAAVGVGVEAQAQTATEPTPRTKADHRQIAGEIADALGETKAWPRSQIRHIVYTLGAKQAQALARRAQEIEDAGGMLALNGKHRRTLGGIFFYLVYTEGKPRAGKVLTRPTRKPKTTMSKVI